MGSLSSHAPVSPAGLIFLTALRDLEVSNVIAVLVNNLTARTQLFFLMFKENLNQEN